jgi:hypothetical protein
MIGISTVDQRQLDGLADQVGVALVLRMHHHGDVAEQGFRAGGGHGEALPLPIGRRRTLQDVV